MSTALREALFAPAVAAPYLMDTDRSSSQRRGYEKLHDVANSAFFETESLLTPTTVTFFSA